MYHKRTPVLPAAIAATCLLLSPAPAFRGGPIGGWNGSVASSGNCMSCHGSQVGSGSVTLAGAPATYSFNQTYDLTVRVADPDQLGAGFQISVEDAVGNHVGALIIADAVNTQPAPGDPGWVTHSSTGVDNAVAGWAALGNAAEYKLQWQAPAADVGEIMFYLAGNAINDDHQAFNGLDTIYLASQSATASDTCSDGEQNNGEAGIDCGGPCPACECLADADCDDGDDCTANLCRDNQCVDNEIVNCCRDNSECDDTNPCTSDTCENLSCTNEAIVGCCLADVECDDGDACTEDHCSAHACVNDTIPICCTANADCDDGVFCNGAEACQADRCEPGTEPCPGQRCDEATRSCVDCLVDANCDDDNPCTDDVCAGGACIHNHNEVECDDGDTCTAADECENGVCAGILVEKCCATDDECDDENGCTEDRCSAGACVNETIPDCCTADCDDDNPCTDDSCAGGACIHDDNEVECDDGDTCTAADECVNGVCTGILVEECCVTADECDDGNECTEDTCGANACRHDPVPDCPASDDDNEPPPGNDDIPDPPGGDSDQPVPNDDSPIPSLPRPAPCGLFGIITFPVLIFGLIGIRSRRRRLTIV